MTVVISSNSNYNVGAAMYFNHQINSISLQNSTFYDNHSTYGGSCIFGKIDGAIENCLFIFNSSLSESYGSFIGLGTSNVTLYNNLFLSNTSNILEISWNTGNLCLN